MLGYCFDQGLNGWALMVTRLVVLVGAGYGLAQYVGIRRMQRDCRECPTPIIPRSVVWAGIVSTAALLFITVVLLLTDCSSPLTPTWRTAYGQAFGWSIVWGGVTIKHGLRYRQATLRMQERLTPNAVEAALRAIDEEHHAGPD